jgi:hypothetical protein
MAVLTWLSNDGGTARSAPKGDLVELSNGDGDAGPTRAKGHAFHGVLEGDSVEDHVAMEVHEETLRTVVDNG